ncbi:TPA: protein-export chaperone SecB [Morganella morganii subsp. morganii]|nr:protein-export chaperone SecB [Morganella morganii]DAP51181.1 MAG TPA: Preprotein translocase subunit SecB [Caudoviricetes sp.]HDU8694695.1 protein-export chaperone SecB [Morganella morganii subsp. morganii]EKW3937917.1 protein-export chaperone SecB [Morganella morganii]HCR4037756.1 protein-export chaperone SecB [Morganella morganii]
MKIKIVYKEVHQLVLQRLEGGEVEQENELRFTLGTEIYHNKNDATLAKFRYTVTATLRDEVSLELIYDFAFQADSELTEDFNGSDAATIMAPNLAYPYIKAYVENIFFISGYKKIVLPYINFFDNPLKPEQ